MVKNILDVRFCRTYDHRPLAVVDGLPGGSAELVPDDLRLIAAALLRIADDCDLIPSGRRSVFHERKASYTIK